MRLFVDSREDGQELRRGIEPSATFYPVTLIAAAGTVYLVILGATSLDAMGRGAGLSADIGDHTAFGIFFSVSNHVL